MGRKSRRKLTGYWLILPGAVWLGLFFVVPFFTLLSSSLYDPNGSVLTGYSMTWHFQNFADAFCEHGARCGGRCGSPGSPPSSAC